MSSLKRTVLGVFSAAVLTAPALAGTVDVSFEETGLGRHVRVHVPGRSRNVFAGHLRHSFSNGTGPCEALDGDYITFCTELTEYVDEGPNEYECSPLADAPGSSPMGAQGAQAIMGIYAYADGQQFETESTSENRDFAAAFQIAIWEVVCDYDGTEDSLDVTAGGLRVTKPRGGQLSCGIRGYLSDLFGAIGAKSSVDGLFAVVNDGCQDQIVMIPLPPPLLLGLASLGAVAWHRRRMHRLLS